jgi:hypothetical protein
MNLSSGLRQLAAEAFDSVPTESQRSSRDTVRSQTLDAELPQLAMNPRCTAERIRRCHLLDERLNGRIGRRGGPGSAESGQSTGDGAIHDANAQVSR